MIHVAVVGGATGREHCLVREFVRKGEHRVSSILWDPHEPIRRLSSSYAVLDLRDPRPIIDHISRWRPDYVVVGQGEALFQGLGDRLRERGIPAIAPTRAQARIESSKSFLRRIMAEISPESSPRWRLFTEVGRDLVAFAQAIGPRVVLKCEGPVRNPRVQIVDAMAEPAGLLETATLFLRRAGAIMIEEFVEGEEVAMISFSDGQALLHSPPFRNFKRVDEADRGEMTSGMGSVAGCGLADRPNTLARMRSITEAVFSWLAQNSEEPYVGCLYGEFKIDPGSDVKVLEYNCRFGNPSTINLSLLLRQGFSTLLDAMIAGSLGAQCFDWFAEWSLSAYVVPLGYTRKAAGVGQPIDFSSCDPDKVYVGKLAFDSETYRLLDSRAIALCARSRSLEEARQAVYEELAKIAGPIHYRTDIGLQPER